MSRSRRHVLDTKPALQPHEPSSPVAPTSRLRFRLIYFVAIPLLAFLAYGNSLQGGFVWDDRPLILDDHTVESFDYLHEIFTNDYSSRNEYDLAYGYYRPIISLTYVIDHAVWGMNAFGFHLTNVVMHGLASLLVVFVLIRIGFGGWASLLAGLLFTVHPIHTENVAWISGRTDVVSLVLLLGAFLAHCFVTDGGLEGHRRILYKSLSYGLFALALLAKEMAIVLLPWVFFYNLQRPGWKIAAQRTIPFLAIFVLYAVWRFILLDIEAPRQPEMHGYGVMALSALPTVFRYLLWAVAPFEQSAYVQNPYVTGPGDPRFLVSLLLAAVVALFLYRSFRARRPVCLLVLALFSSFLPIVNVVRIGGPNDMGAVMAERFAYYPSVLLLALVAAGIGVLAVRMPRGAPLKFWTLRGGIAVLLIAMTGGTIVRNRVWKDDLTLYEDMLAKTPEAALIWSNLAYYHIRNGNLEEAKAAVARLSKFGQDSYYYWSSRAFLHVMLGEYEKAIPLQEEIVAWSVESNAPARNNLAFLYQKTGRTRQAIEILEGLISQGTSYSDIRCNLAQALQRDGRIDDARREYRLATRSSPESVPIGTAWAGMELGLGRFEEAEGILAELLRFHPEDPTLHQNLAIAQLNSGREDQALRSFLRAIEVDPTYVRARLSYGKLLQLRGDDAQAREQFEEVIRLAPNTDHARQARERLR